MYVMGKVGSLISQGVYSVATPFHPFGGAVDIIVVQQQDGSFRTTPWHVRFGKFQGVLKGAEKVVRIEVNGAEANFHMYLDNSGEAYFIREVESSKESEANGGSKDSYTPEDIREEDTSVDFNKNEDPTNENYTFNGNKDNHFDPDEVQAEDERNSLILDRLERTDSGSERRFYDFQDDQSSFDDSIELSEYGSTRYDNLDSVEQLIQSPDSNSEMVLMSVDGHVLTAPISSLDGNSENVSSPQFPLGPGEGIDSVENNGEHNTNEDAWATDYPRVSGASQSAACSDNICMNEGDDSENHVEVREGDKQFACQVQGSLIASNPQKEIGIDSNSVDSHDLLKKEDAFNSCMDLPALAIQFGDINSQENRSLSHSYEDKGVLLENSPQNILEDEKDENGSAVELRSEELRNAELAIPSCRLSSELQVVVGSNEGSAVESNINGSDGLHVLPVGTDQELEVQQVGVALTCRESESGSQEPALKYESSEIDTVELQTISTSEDMKNDTSTRFDLSLCGHLLSPGMGLSSAAEAFEAQRISGEEFSVSAASIIKNENLVVKIQESYLPWDKAAPIVLGMAVYGLCLPIESSDAIPVEHDEAKSKEDSRIASTPSGSRWRLWPIPFRKFKTLEHASSHATNKETIVNSELGSPNQLAESMPTPGSSNMTPRKHFVRTKVPTTEQITSLNLKEGQNMVTFIFSTRVLGIQKVEAHVYLWKWNVRIVISDVDGTITRSDVLGQFMPLVGKDWTQSGVARLFSAIEENGYQLLFLSARAISQAYLTRSFLVNLKQDGKALPNGPVVISPDGLFPSLYREIVRRAPHEFKIACLEGLKALFPPDHNPFYAGFGNRDTDELSYTIIGIPKGKIFIINPKGEVAISHHCTDVKSYTSLHTLVNDMFPPTSLIEQEDYNSWNFWKMPLPDIDDL